MSAIRLYRALLRELRLSSPGERLVSDAPAVQYAAAQFRKYQTTDQQLCKAKEEMRFLGQTYVCYLESLRRSAAIQKHFKGCGERSVEETASLVGFKLPHDPMK